MVDLTVNEVAAEIRQGHAIAAVHHKRRKAANFISAQIIGLDFDTMDAASRIETLLADDLIGRHAAIVHTTSQHRECAPRARVLFFLDRKGDDRKRYVQYVAALMRKYALVDQYCKDACRLWYGAQGCQAVVRPNLQPIGVQEAEKGAQYTEGNVHTGRLPTLLLQMDQVAFQQRRVHLMEQGDVGSGGVARKPS
jgi:hypothetical protein